jgi:protein-S-isoprenylcysteine O-methyltransferase Ste14
MATIAIPVAICVLWGTNVGWGLPGPVAAATVGIGAALIVLGLRLMRETISLFSQVGEGTLAPWDPTRRLVVRGPYLRVRNPMISGVAMVMLGEAIVLGSTPVLAWWGLFALSNAVFIPIAEEPGLRRRFGEDYAEYCRHVPRWIPRRSPWPGASSGTGAG